VPSYLHGYALITLGGFAIGSVDYAGSGAGIELVTAERVRCVPASVKMDQ
jgi:hypothetical protein